MFSNNTPLILLLMARLTYRYWDEEAFREVVVGPSFNEVKVKLRQIDDHHRDTVRA